jgi:c-di-GMP-binding flagellar brake protein YcgR
VLIANGLFRNVQWKPLTRPRRAESDDLAPEAGINPMEKRMPLSALRLGISDSLQMQSLTDQSPEPYYVRLIGYVEKRSVTVTTPVADGGVLLMREGQAFVLRGFSGRYTFAFNVNILRVCHLPFPYLHLSYPAFVQSTAMRQHDRIKTNIVVSVSNLTQPELAEKSPAVVIDLSLMGAMLASRKPLGKTGDTLAISIRLIVGDMDVYLMLNALARNERTEVSEARPELMCRLGLEFLEMAPNDKMILHNFVYTKIVEDL